MSAYVEFLGSKQNTALSRTQCHLTTSAVIKKKNSQINSEMIRNYSESLISHKTIPLFTGWQSWPLTLNTLLYSRDPSLSPTQSHNSSHTVTATKEIRCNAGFTHYTIVHSAGDRDSGAQRAKSQDKKKKEDQSHTHTHTHLSLHHTFTTHTKRCNLNPLQVQQFSLLRLRMQPIQTQHPSASSKCLLCQLSLTHSLSLPLNVG